MKYARAPNGETVTFSDDHSDAEIMRYLATAPQYQPVQAPAQIQQPRIPQAPGQEPTGMAFVNQTLGDFGRDLSSVYRGGIQGEAQAELGLRNLVDRNNWGDPNAPHLQKSALEKNYAQATAAMPSNMDFVQQQLAGLAGGLGGMLASPLPSFGGPIGFAGQGAQGKIDQAKQLGITDQNKITEAMNQAAMVGGAAGLGMEALGGIAPLIAKPFEGMVGKTVAGVASHAVPLAGIGAAQQLGENYITQQNFDPNQNLWEGVPQAALTMGAIGGLSHLGGHMMDVAAKRILPDPIKIQAAKDAEALAQQQDEAAQLARQNQLRETARAAQGNGVRPEAAQAEAPPPTPALEQTGQPAPQPSPIPEQGGPPPEQGAQPPPQQASAFDVSQLPPEIQQIIGGQGGEAPVGNPEAPPPQPVSTPAPPEPTPAPVVSQAPEPAPSQVITQPNTNGLSDIVDAVKDPKQPKMEGPSLLEFISKNGGVNDTGGELTALDADKWHLGKPGKGKIVKDSGLSPDAMAQKLQDAGYIQTSDPTGQPTSQDLYDAVQRELAGQKIHVQTPENQVKSDLIQKYQAAQDQLTQMGLDPSKMSHQDIAHALTNPDDYITSLEREPTGTSQEIFPETNSNEVVSGGNPSAPVASANSPVDMASNVDGSGSDIPFKATRPLSDIESQLPSDVVSELAPKGKSVEVGDSIDAAPIMQKLKAELNRQGLGDVGIQLHDALWDETDPSRLVSGKIEQTPAGHIIHLATRIYDPNMSHEDLVNKLKSVMSHETVHAMRDLGVFKPADWNLLTRESMKRQLPDGKGSFYDKAVYDYAPRDKDGQLIDLNSLHPAEKAKIIDHIQEEAVAEMYRHFSDGNRRVNSVPTGLLNKMMNHMVRMVRAIGRSKVDKLLDSVRSGELSRRPLAPGQKLAPKDRYMMAYHGTRHLFKDFNVDKIGTGEGNRDYGWGFYFSQNKKVAEHYRQQEALPGTGRIYRVDLPDEKHMLDWDNSFDDHPKAVQSRIIKAIDSLGQEGNFDAEQLADGLRDGNLGHMTGQEIYRELTHLLKEHTGDYENPDKSASLLLHKNKVPGTKFLDQGSRADHIPEGARTRNYVVYHHDSIKVKGKEEQLGPRAPNWNENAERAHAQSALTLGSRDAANPDLDRTPIVLYTKDTKAGTRYGDPEGIHFFDKDKSNYRGFSASTDPETASNWGGNYDERGAVYPIHIFPKKIADFRNPEHLNEAVNYQIEKKYGPNAARDFADKDALATPESGMNADYNYEKRVRDLTTAANALVRPHDEPSTTSKKIAEKQQVQADVSYIYAKGGELKDKFRDLADAQMYYRNTQKALDDAKRKKFDMEDTGEAFDSPEGIAEYAQLDEQIEDMEERWDATCNEYDKAKMDFATEAAKHKEFLQTPVMDEVLKNLSNGNIPNELHKSLTNKYIEGEAKVNKISTDLENVGLSEAEIYKEREFKNAEAALILVDQRLNDPQSYRYEFYKIQDEFNKRIKEAKKPVPDGPLSNEDAQKYFPDIYNPMKKGDYSFWEDPEMLAKMGAQATYMKEHADDPKGALNVFVPEDHASIIKSVFNRGTWDTSDPYIRNMATKTTGGPASYAAIPGSYKPDLGGELILRSAALPELYRTVAGAIGQKLESAPLVGMKSPSRIASLKWGISRESFERGAVNWLAATGDQHSALALLYKKLFENESVKNLDINNAYIASSIAPQKAQGQILAFRRGSVDALYKHLESIPGAKGLADNLKGLLQDGGVIEKMTREIDPEGRAIATPHSRQIVAEAYAYAKHALEYNDYGRRIMQREVDDGQGGKKIDPQASGMSDEEANTIIDYIEKKAPPAQRDAILKAHDQMMRIAEETRLKRIQYGLEPDWRTARKNLVTEQTRLRGLLSSESDPKKANEYQGQIDKFQKAIDKIPDYKFYVPLKTSAEDLLYDSNGNATDNAQTDFSGGAKFGARGAEDFNRTGRSSYAGDIIPNMLNMHENSIQRGIRNEAGNLLYNTIKEAFDAGDPSIGEHFGKPEQIPYHWVRNDTDGSVELKPVGNLELNPKSFITKINGIDHKIEIKSNVMQVALNGFDGTTGMMSSMTQGLRGMTNFFQPVLDPFSRLNHFVNAGASIPFAVRLFFKHTALAKLNADAFDGDIAKNIGKYSNHYLKGLLFNDPAVMKELQGLKERGGVMQPYGFGSVDNFKQEMDAILSDKSFKDAPWHVKQAKMNLVLHKAEQFLTGFTNKVEWTTRLAVNRAFIESGMSPERAAYMAQELTGNFGRRGAATPSLAKLYPFYNAGVQADNASISSLLRMGARKGGAQVAKWVARLTAIGFAAGVYNDLMGQQHKDDMGNNPYWMMTDKQRTGASIPLFIPGTNTFLKIPTPFKLLSIPINAGNRLYAMSSGHMGAWDGIGSTLGEFVGGVDHFESSPAANPYLAAAPGVLRPGLSTMANINWNGAPIHPTAMGYPPPPKSQQSQRNTPEYAKAMAEGISTLTGGNGGAKPGAVEMYPDDIDYYMKQLGGGLGDVATRVATAGEGIFLPNHRAATGKEAYNPVTDFPVASSVFGKVGKAQVGNAFYNVGQPYSEAAQEQALLRKRLNMGDYSAQLEMQKGYAQNPEVWGAAPFYESVQRSVSQAHTDIKKIQQDPNFSVDQKAQAVQQLEDEIYLQQRMFISKVTRGHQNDEPPSGIK